MDEKITITFKAEDLWELYKKVMAFEKAWHDYAEIPYRIHGQDGTLRMHDAAETLIKTFRDIKPETNQ